MRIGVGARHAHFEKGAHRLANALVAGVLVHLGQEVDGAFPLRRSELEQPWEVGVRRVTEAQSRDDEPGQGVRPQHVRAVFDIEDPAVDHRVQRVNERVRADFQAFGDALADVRD